MEVRAGKAKVLVEAAMRFPDSTLDRCIKVLAALTAVALVALGVYYYLDRFYSSAPNPVSQELKALEEAVLSDPQNPEARVRVAWMYLDQGYKDQAVAQFNEALKLRENYQAALIGLGTSFIRNNDSAAAQGPFEQVVALNENNPYRRTLRELQGVYYYLGTIYSGQKRYDDAIASFKQALEMDRADADSLYGLGMVYVAQGDYSTAQPVLEQVVKFDPAFVDGYKGLGTVYENEGKPAQVLWVRAMLSFLDGKFDQSMDQLKKAVRADPDLPEAYQGMGLVYEKKNQPQEALQAFKTALEKDPSLPLAQAGVAKYGRQ